MPLDVYRDISPDKHVVLAEVDAVGAALLRDRYPTCVSIFITAPPVDLLRRIRKRPDDDMSSDDLRQRMHTAQNHIRAAKEFQYVVYNQKDRLCQAVTAIDQIITAERMKVRAGFDLEAIVPSAEFEVLEESLLASSDGQ
jgi:guanylate kinase